MDFLEFIITAFFADHLASKQEQAEEQRRMRSAECGMRNKKKKMNRELKKMREEIEELRAEIESLKDEDADISGV